MLEFELKDLIRNDMKVVPAIAAVEYVAATETDPEILAVAAVPAKVEFYLTPVIGVVGNTYPGFLNSLGSITVTCLKSKTGDEMDLEIIAAGATYLTENFPPLT